MPMPTAAEPAFVVLHADAHLTLATDRLLLAPEQAPALADALALAQTLAQLRDEAAARVLAAVDAGQAQGRAEGQALGHTQGLQLAAAALAKTTHDLTERAAVDAAELQQQVVALALLVVRRITADLAPDAVLAALARKAFEHLAAAPDGAGAPACQLRLHPALLPAVQQQLADQQPALRVIADDSLAPLDCVLETPGGRLLAGLEPQLARVQASLMRPPADSRADVAIAP